MEQRSTLAWHETLELHELVAFNSIGLMKLKIGLPEITCEELQSLYREGISNLESNLRELIKFYPSAPKPGVSSQYREADNGFYAGDFLAFAKSAVRNYSVAITETATPQLRAVLKKQLNGAVDTHAKVFYYMYERSIYPSYDLNQLLQNDVELANKAISM
ncbi:spore coat protein [Sutcliffiella cohnii]